MGSRKMLSGVDSIVDRKENDAFGFKMAKHIYQL
jgi:hypothetical protein